MKHFYRRMNDTGFLGVAHRTAVRPLGHLGQGLPEPNLGAVSTRDSEVLLVLASLLSSLLPRNVVT